MFELLENGIKLTLILVLGFLALRWFATRRNSVEIVDKHRVLILLLLGALILLFKVSEDVIWGESGPVDREVLLWIHAHTTPALARFCYIITFTGSWKFIMPAGAAALCAFVVLRRKWEALFLVLCMLAAWILTWLLKTTIGRERPALWATESYWGSSFPSGHTLNTTCFATALVVCVSRIWPEWTKAAALVGALWALLVGISRMVLGVHFPTDVIAAGCIGLIIPFAVRLSLRWLYNPKHRFP
jgi:undecaprenyl-diphosphatase